MLKQLKFVQGAVSKQSFNPTLTHFNIQSGTITGCNSWLTIQAPLPVDIAAAPKAVDFVKAISACDGTMSLHMTPGGKLAVHADKFKSYIDCVDASTFPSIPTIDDSLIHPVRGDFMRMITTLAPFVNTDENATHSWTNSIVMRPDGCSFATSNVVLVQLFTGVILPLEENLLIPYHTIQELLRIKEQPTQVGFDSKGIMFYYGDGMIMHSALRINSADVNIDNMFPPVEKCPPLQEGMFAALKKIKPFLDETGRVFMHGNEIHTAEDDGMGTTVQWLGNMENKRGFTYRHLMSIQDVAVTMDFSRDTSKPCVFYGDCLRGMILGLA